MKKTLLYIASAMLAVTSFSACDDDFTQPPLDDFAPKATLTPNTTMLELKEAFDQNEFNYATEIGTRADGEHYIVKGRIVSTGTSGNIYQKLAVEDETGGMIFSIYNSKLYNTYKYGQEIVVDVTGMYIGNYGNGNQIGGAPMSGNTYPSRMESTIWDAQCEKDGLSQPSLVVPADITIAEAKQYQNNRSDFLAWQGRYVRFNGVHFQTPGEPLGVSGQSNNSRTLLDDNGNSIVVNTSGYSTMWSLLCPSGTGSVEGILTYYSKGWQLLMLDEASMIGFTPAEPLPTPAAELYSETFKSDQGLFTIDIVSKADALSYVWSHDSYGYMKASAYLSGTSYPSDAWLISPEFDLTSVTEPAVVFEHCVNKFPTLTDATRLVSFNVKVSGGEWEQVEIPTFSDNASWTIVSSGTIDLAKYAGKKIQVGFRYTSEDGVSGTWEVKNFVLSGNGTMPTPTK